MDTVKKIKKLMTDRGWSVNTLAVEAELTQSTVQSIFSRGTPPKIETLERICSALGISLSQFFCENEEFEVLNDKEKRMIMSFRKLNEKKQNAILSLIE